MKRTLFTTLASLIFAGAAISRTWTSADSTKTFEADFVSATDDSVTVMRKGRKQTFKIKILSEADQKWIAEEREKMASTEADKVAAENFGTTNFGKALSKLHKLNGKKFSKHKIESLPKMFILYYSASW